MVESFSLSRQVTGLVSLPLKYLLFANWSVSKMSDTSFEWHFWASKCPMCDESTQTMVMFHHTWQDKALRFTSSTISLKCKLWGWHGTQMDEGPAKQEVNWIPLQRQINKCIWKMVTKKKKKKSKTKSY